MLSVSASGVPADKLLTYLPRSAAAAFMLLPVAVRSSLGEVRLRMGGPVSVSRGADNFFLTPLGRLSREPEGAVTLSEGEISETVGALCGSSYHTQAENIRRGFIAMPNGFRAGVVGTVGVNASGELSVNQITSINLRIPRFIKGIALPLLERFRNDGHVAGTLLYSPPGGGKTTMLRDLICALSKGEGGLPPKRTAVVDTRREIYMPQLDGGLADFLSGYPKAEGIELATRTMNPEVIVCDEINSDDRPDLIRQTAMCGVPIIATTHAGCRAELMEREWLARLIESRVFVRTVCLYRSEGEYRIKIEDS